MNVLCKQRLPKETKEWEKVLNKCLIKGLHLLSRPQPLRNGTLIVESVKSHPLINPSMCIETLLCSRCCGKYRSNKGMVPPFKEFVYNKVEAIK